MPRMTRNPPVLMAVWLILVILINHHVKAEDSLHQQQHQLSSNTLSLPLSSPPPPPTTTTTTKDIAVASQGSITCSTPPTAPHVDDYKEDNNNNSINEDDSPIVTAFFRDMQRLDALRGQLPVLSPSHSNFDSTYTKSWTLHDWEQHQVRSFQRYRNNLASWIKSPTARAVIPSVAVAVAWSVVVKLLYETLFDNLRKVVGSNTSFSSGVSAFTAPIGLMLALRTNRALNRLLEARSMFGKMVRATSSLAGVGCAYLHNDNDIILLGRYLAIYGWAIKGALRKEDTTQICQTVLPPEEAEWILSSPADTPTSIVFRLRQLFATTTSIRKDGDNTETNVLPTAAASAMEGYLCELESVLGVCKRLIASPIPPTFSRHTSRILCLYLGLLPVALVSTTNNSLSSILISVTLLSYVFIGIDETACEIENPFPLIPMFQLSGTLQTNIQNQMAMMAMLRENQKQ